MRCTVTPGNQYRDDSGTYGAGDTVTVSDAEAIRLKAEGVLHFEDPPKPTKKIEVKEED